MRFLGLIEKLKFRFVIEGVSRERIERVVEELLFIEYLLCSSKTEFIYKDRGENRLFWVCS